MKIILFTHPSTLKSTSMVRVARLIGEGMEKRGHQVEYWTSPFCFGRLPFKNEAAKKWLGYIDQYIIFPFIVKNKLKKISNQSLFVFVDQALAMWLPYVSHLPHVLHCNDLLAVRSAMGEFSENPTSWTGRKYQQLILSGLRKGKNFISISEATRNDLNRFVSTSGIRNELVYLDLNFPFGPLPNDEAKELLKEVLKDGDEKGFFLHVGGNQWYKNRTGVIELYRDWVKKTKDPVPLWIIGQSPTEEAVALARDIPNGGQVRFLSGLSDAQVMAAYNLASLFLFPSLEEGFGWPIAEAMACGTPVLTTSHAPMSEVGGDPAIYLRRKIGNHDPAWADEGGDLIIATLNASPEEKKERRTAGLMQAAKFSKGNSLDNYERIYREISQNFGTNS